jgi:hypothetical protein
MQKHFKLKVMGCNESYIITCRGVCVTYKTGFGLDDWIYCTLYIYTVRDYRQYSATAILHTFSSPLHTH